MENFQKNATAAIAGVCRQLSNAYLNSSNVNVLLAGRNVIVSRLATLVKDGRLSMAPGGVVLVRRWREGTCSA